MDHIGSLYGSIFLSSMWAQEEHHWSLAVAWSLGCQLPPCDHPIEWLRSVGLGQPLINWTTGYQAQNGRGMSWPGQDLAIPRMTMHDLDRA